MYKGEEDPYLEPGTDVLRNRLGIRDAGKLEAVEYELTSIRAQQGVPAGRLDYVHYKSIHRHLFQDVYEWAGKPRTVNIAKGGSSFCRVEFIDAQMNKLLGELRAERYLVELDFSIVAQRAAHYLVEVTPSIRSGKVMDGHSTRSLAYCWNAQAIRATYRRSMQKRS